MPASLWDQQLNTWIEKVAHTTGTRRRRVFASSLKQSGFETLAPALTAQVNCAYAYAAASSADAWLAEHFQKQKALK